MGNPWFIMVLMDDLGVLGEHRLPLLCWNTSTVNAWKHSTFQQDDNQGTCLIVRVPLYTFDVFAETAMLFGEYHHFCW